MKWPDLALCYNNLGNAHFGQENYTVAIEQYQVAIPIYERLSPRSTDLARCYRNLGLAYDQQGNYAAAIEQFQLAIPIRERLSPGSTDLARCYISLGFAYNQQGNYTAAIEQWQLAIPIYGRLSPGSIDLAKCYYNLGNAYRGQGNYTAVFEQFQLAVPIYERHWPGSRDLADCYYSLGVSHVLQYDYTTAAEKLQMAVSILERQSPGSTELAERYTVLGSVYSLQGNATAALEKYQLAVTIFERESPRSTELATCYDSIGDTYNNQGNYADAVHVLDQALDIFPRNSDDYTTALCNKIQSLIATGDVATAQQVLQEDVVGAAGSTTILDPKARRWVLWAQAEVLAEQGQWTEAQHKIATAVSLFQGDDAGGDLASIVSLHGLILLESGQIQSSRREMEKSKKLFEEVNLQNFHAYYVLLNRLGELELRSKNTSEAAVYFLSSREYFAARAPNSVSHVESLCGQALLESKDAVMPMLTFATKICEENGIRCRAYRIAQERLQQSRREEAEKAKKVQLAQQKEAERKAREEIVLEQRRRDEAEKAKQVLEAQQKEAEQRKLKEEAKEVEAKRLAIQKLEHEQTALAAESKVIEGRGLLQKALECDDSATVACPFLPTEYLSFASDSWSSKIGSGGFGAVYKGRDKVANFTFAIKTILPDRLDDEEKEKFKDEIQVGRQTNDFFAMLTACPFKLLSTLRHPNIIRVLGFCESPERLCMVLEFAAGGSVHKILASESTKARLSPNSRLYIAESLVAALEYLHSKNVFHRDVKPENICLWEGWELNPKLVLIDFGIASQVATKGAAQTMTSNPGTTPYMADEYLNYPFKFSAKSEVFSVGCVLICLLTGNCSFIHFNHRTCTVGDIMNNIDLSGGAWPIGCDQELATITVEALQQNESKRPSIPDFRGRLQQIRLKSSSDEFLPAATKSRINSFTARSRPSRLRNNISDGEALTCVRCGLARQNGISCPKNHFICSDGTCLEELVREQFGGSKFRCCGNRCSKSFEAIDLYGKVSSLLYGQLLTAMDQSSDRNDMLVDIQNAIAEQLQKQILPSLAQTLGSASESQLSLDSIQSTIDQLKQLAGENDMSNKRMEKQMARLMVKQERGTADITEEQEKLVSKMDALMEAHADGVAKLASGRLQCPRLFVWVPVRSKRGRVARSIGLANEYQLYFLCAWDHTPVKTSILIKQPKKWIKKALPIVKFAFLAMRLVVASYGVAMPAFVDMIPGVSGSPTLDAVVDEMANFLDSEALENVEHWIDEASESDVSLAEYMESRAQDIPEEAYAALALEAYKPENRGWMQEMEIVQKQNAFAWVKQENTVHLAGGGNVVSKKSATHTYDI